MSMAAEQGSAAGEPAGREKGKLLDIRDHVQEDEYKTTGDPFVSDAKMCASNINVFYGEKQAIKNISLDIGKNEVIAMIGPSGCGKSTFLRCLNRMNDIIPGCRVEGEITLDEQQIYSAQQDPVLLRARVGMVFQKPNPFPKSIYENVAFGPRIHGLTANKAELDEVVETSLVKAGLWDEVKERGPSGDAAPPRERGGAVVRPHPPGTTDLRLHR